MRILRRIGLGTFATALVTSTFLLPGAASPANAAAASTPLSRFGASVSSTDDVGRISGLMGRPLNSVRVFFNGTPRLWSNSALLNSIPDNATVSISFQTGTPDQIQTFLASRPPGIKCYATYWHEPEDNFTTSAAQATYRANWRLYAPALRAAGCTPTLIMLKWALNPNSGWDWHWWYPGSDVIDLLAFDAYNGSVKKAAPTYTDPVKFLQPIVDVSNATGKPWALAEVGSYIVGTAADRANWAHGVAVQVDKYKVPFANWWDQFGTDGIRDFTLDQATAQAWNVTGPPGAPANVSLTAGATSAGASWTTPDEGGAAITNYTIATTDVAAGTSTTQTVLAPATSATATNLVAGVSYSITVTATNSLGTSPPSAAQTITPGATVTVPDAPAIGNATPGNTSASVTWTAPASNGGSSLTGYTVTASDPSGNFKTADVDALATTGTVTGLTNGQSYRLTVAARNGLGVGQSSAASNAVTPAVPAAAPGIGHATAGNASLGVTWTAPTNDGGTPITGYRITAVNTTNQPVASQVVSASATSGSVGGLVNGRVYTAKVSAINAIGDSPASALSNQVTPMTVPDAPGLGVSTGGVKTDTVVSATAYWILPASNGGSPITGYRVIAEHVSGGTVLDSKTSALQPAANRKLQFTGLVTGQSYRFKVCAVNAVGDSIYAGPTNTVGAW